MLDFVLAFVLITNNQMMQRGRGKGRGSSWAGRGSARGARRAEEAPLSSTASALDVAPSIDAAVVAERSRDASDRAPRLSYQELSDDAEESAYSGDEHEAEGEDDDEGPHFLAHIDAEMEIGRAHV